MYHFMGSQGWVGVRRVALVGLSAAGLLLAGCSGFRPISKIENGGQSFDNLGTVEGTTIDVAKIAPRDTIVVADDGGKAVTTSPNAVEVTMMESFSVPLSLGIPDFDLRFGWMFKKPELDAKGEPPKVFRLASRKLVAVDNDGWMPGGSIALTEKQIVSGVVPVRFKITAINAGNRDFTGKLALYDRMPGNIEFDKHLRAGRVYDASTAKAILGLIPFVGLFTSGMDQYQPVPSIAFTPQHSVDSATRLVKYDSDTVTLKPGEGVEVEFAARVMLPRDEALLKARMRPPQQQ
jgi:hypothetical protein